MRTGIGTSDLLRGSDYTVGGLLGTSRARIKGCGTLTVNLAGRGCVFSNGGHIRL